MAARKKESNVREFKPASDPKSREQQLVNLAVNLAERQLIDGTASPSVINHYLKIGSTREVLEREILAKQAILTGAKADEIASGKGRADNAAEAIEAMKKYSNSSN